MNEKQPKLIYVYTLWDKRNGYWTEYTPQNIESINDSDSYYYVDEEGFKYLNFNSLF